MTFDRETLNCVYDRTSGYCHICRKKLAFKNYGSFGSRGAWEVEHSNAQANGGSHRLSNLYPACIFCNRSKGAASTRAARAKHGQTRAPLSAQRRKHAKAENAFLGAGSGALLGGKLAGPVGAAIGGVLGALFGHGHNPDKQ